MTSVLLLEAAGPESQAVVAAAAATGITVHSATHSGMYDGYPPHLRDALTKVVFTDFADPDRALADLSAHILAHRISGVLTLHEFLTPLAARLAMTHGLPGNDPALAPAARNKIAMAERFAACGVPAPQSWVLRGPDDLAALLTSDVLPLVVKPAENAGSAGVTIAATPDEAAAACQAAAAASRQPHYGIALDGRVLAQRYVEGTEYSVESITQHSRTTHLAITAKTTTSGAYRVETGHDLPAVLPAEQQEQILTTAERAIAAAGIRDTASHTEVMLTPNRQCVVIEIAARPGSGQIGVLLQHALGLDPWTAYLHLALGRPADLTPTRHGHAAVRFLTSPTAGYLAAVRGLPDTGPAVHAVHLRRAIGDPVQAPTGNSGRIGHLIVTGADPAKVTARADALLAAIRVDVHASLADPGAPGQRDSSAIRAATAS